MCDAAICVFICRLYCRYLLFCTNYINRMCVRMNLLLHVCCSHVGNYMQIFAFFICYILIIYFLVDDLYCSCVMQPFVYLYVDYIFVTCYICINSINGRFFRMNLLLHVCCSHVGNYIQIFAFFICYILIILYIMFHHEMKYALFSSLTS